MTATLLSMAFSAAVALTGSTRPVDNNHILIYGKVLEIIPQEMKEIPGESVQVMIYQEDELYVAFNTDDKGKYEFNLPVEHNYTIVFGTENYVAKRVTIDAHALSDRKTGHAVKLDMGIFKPVEGVDFSFLEAPIASFYFQQEVGQIAPDEDYSFKMAKQMRKCYKQILKASGT